MARKVTIYGLADPRDESRVRYVGASLSPASRLTSHITNAHLERPEITLLALWILRLELAGVAPRYVSLAEVDETVAPEQEILWIAKMKQEGHHLFNTKVGGQGGHRRKKLEDRAFATLPLTITRGQYDFLVRLSEESGECVPSLIREAIDDYRRANDSRTNTNSPRSSTDDAAGAS